MLKKIYNDPSRIRNTAHANFDDKKVDNVRFLKVISLPAVPQHLTSNCYVDEINPPRVDGSSLLGIDTNEILKLAEQGSIIPNSTLTSPKTKIETPTKSSVDSLVEKK